MKKFLSIILIIGMVLSFSGMATMENVIADDEPVVPTIEKPLYVTVLDELGNPVNGAKIEVKDQSGTVVASDELLTEIFLAFLGKGTYTVELTEVPDGYIAIETEKTVDIDLTEGEEKDDIRAKSIQSTDPNHKIFCKHDPSHLEVYKIIDNDSEITGYCFNQNYDAPDITDPECTYKRLVGSPDLLEFIAQNERTDMTTTELYHHILSIIYHRDDIQAKYGFDDLLTDYLVNMALKNFTDGDIDSFKTTDENGNNLVKRKENGQIDLDENGNYQFLPGGSTLGSIVGHANGANSGNPDYVFPQDVKDAWHEMVEMTDHPSDYFLYIYYPKNFVSKEYGIAHGWVVPAHYANLYYADAYQCLMSTFTVTPVREQFTLRKVTDITVTKVWDDNDNEAQVRPSLREFQNSLHLLANGEDVTSQYSDNISIVDNGDGTFTVAVVNLPELDEDKQEITYTIKEDPISGYTADKTTVANGETITNTYTPPETVDITVEKTWADNNDAAKKRPASITVNLLADGSTIQTVEIKPDEKGNWTYTFTDLPKCKDDGKTEIVYTVTENAVDGYTTTVEGFKITNSLKEKPHTGDTLGLNMWIGMLAAAIAAAAAILIAWRKKCVR